MAEPLAWDSLRGNKPRGSTGGRPWFGMCNDMQLALAICGAICTGRFLPWVGVPGSRANVEGASRFSPGADVGGISLVEHAPVVSSVSVQMWGGVNPVLSANTACVSRICADACVGWGELSPGADVGGMIGTSHRVGVCVR